MLAQNQKKIRENVCADTETVYPKEGKERFVIDTKLWNIREKEAIVHL